MALASSSVAGAVLVEYVKGFIASRAASHARKADQEAGASAAAIAGKFQLAEAKVESAQEILPAMLLHIQSQDSKIETLRLECQATRSEVQKCELERAGDKVRHAENILQLRIENDRVLTETRKEVQLLVDNGGSMNATFQSLVAEFAAYRARHPSNPTMQAVTPK